VIQQLFKDLPFGSLSSLTTEGLGWSNFGLHLTTSTGRDMITSADTSGPFTTQNEAITTWLDQLARQFSPNLKAKEGDCNLISNSALIGGYLFLLCSMAGVNEQVEIFRDGFATENKHNGYNLEVHFKYLLICRIQELLDQILNAARIQDLQNERKYLCSNAYAATVVARTELHYFKGGIRNGSLRDNVSQQFSISTFRSLLSTRCLLK
jgi:hypothetical protein